MQITTSEQLQKVLAQELQSIPITDVHTHLYAADFGKLLLWGIDDLLTYHYLIAEYFRYSTESYAEFFALPKEEQANKVWQQLFVERSPISEAQRGILTILAKLGLDVASRDLSAYREFFASQTTAQYLDKVLSLSNVQTLVMTNDPFDPDEKQIWDNGGYVDPRFKGALRIDAILNKFDVVLPTLQSWGYAVTSDLDSKTISEVRRFLAEWIDKVGALYVAASLPPTFKIPEDSTRSRLVEQCVLPVCLEKNIPFAMMIGVNKLVNFKLGLAGDCVGQSDLRTVEYLCSTHPKNKFLITTLSRENQHALSVTARKFGNLMVFGCWWFLNNPSIIEEMTRMRTELLGLSYIPQHSDARVLDQLIYKWEHSRLILHKVLTEKYSDLLTTGWVPTTAEVRRDLQGLLNNNFWDFLNR